LFVKIAHSITRRVGNIFIKLTKFVVWLVGFPKTHHTTRIFSNKELIYPAEQKTGGSKICGVWESTESRLIDNGFSS